MKEAAARIKINKLLEAAGWRFFADAKGPANIQLEPSVKLTTQALDELGENFEKASKGFIDFLLLNEKGFPFIVLEAKAEGLSPLVGKEQAPSLMSPLKVALSPRLSANSVETARIVDGRQTFDGRCRQRRLVVQRAATNSRTAAPRLGSSARTQSRGVRSRASSIAVG